MVFKNQYQGVLGIYIGKIYDGIKNMRYELGNTKTMVLTLSKKKLSVTIELKTWVYDLYLKPEEKEGKSSRGWSTVMELKKVYHLS